MHFKLASFCVYLLLVGTASAQPPSKLSFTIERTVAHHGFDGEKCWVHARAGAIPARKPGNDSDTPLVVMTMQKLLLSGSDIFYALNETRSSDLGAVWTEPKEYASFARQTFGSDPEDLPTGASIAPQLLQRATRRRFVISRPSGMRRASGCWGSVTRCGIETIA